MNSSILSKYIPCENELHHMRLVDLFKQLESLSSLFYAIIIQEKVKYKFAYVSESTEKLIGYPLEKFSYHEGANFLYSIIPSSYRKSVMEQETYFFKKARDIDVDFNDPFIMDINSALQRSGGNVLRVRMVTIVLEFTTERTPHLAVNTWQLIDGFSSKRLLESKFQIESILLDVHSVYKLACRPKVSKSIAAAPTRLSYAVDDCDELTRQEYKVLKLLADGASSKIIADKLNISYNTAESHRKHLLQKFKAVNIAEMIKKATKVYWLE